MSASEKPGKLMDAGRYMDTATIMRELGIKRNAAEALMLRLKKIELPGTSKNYVLRSDVEAAMREAERKAAA